MIKRLLAFIMVLLLSIESFAAVVGDNDGAAFITKAEFDSMKNDFQAQINKYNSSIDDKIDGAIAGYLEGIVVSDKPDNYFEKVKSTVNGNLLFLNYLPGLGTNYCNSYYTFSKEKNYSVNYKVPRTTYPFWWVWTVSNRSINFYTRENTSASWTKTTITFGDQTRIGLLFERPSKTKLYYGSSASSPKQYGINWIDMPILIVDPPFTDYYFDADQYVSLQIYREGTLQKTQNSTVYEASSRTFSTSLVQSGTQDGSGSAWQYAIAPNGRKYLERYWETFTPLVAYSLAYKTYKDYSGSVQSGTASIPDNNTCNYSPTQPTSYGSSIDGTRYGGYTTNNLVGYMNQNIALNKMSTDTRDYSLCQWGQVPTDTIYANISEPLLTKSSTKLNSTLTDFSATTATIEGASQSISKVTNTLYDIKVQREQFTLNDFVNIYLSYMVGDPVKLGGGTLIAKTGRGNRREYVITINAKLYDKDNIAKSGSVSVLLSKHQFNNGNYIASSDRVVDGTIVCDSSGNGQIVFNNVELDANIDIWINLYGQDSNRIAELSGFSIDVES